MAAMGKVPLLRKSRLDARKTKMSNKVAKKTKT